MKVDYHVHLEEGPYSFNWWKRTVRAIEQFIPIMFEPHSKEWMYEQSKIMNRRMEDGSFSSYWLDFYLQQAKKLGLQEVGIVDHLYRFKEKRPYYEKYMHLENDELGSLQEKWLGQVSTESMATFISFIEREKGKWEKEGVRLKLGIEADFFPGCEEDLSNILAPYHWDYVIGSVHFYNGWGFDNPDTKDYFNKYDLKALYDRHFQVVEEAISSKLFDIVAHLDNLKVFGFRPNENDLRVYYQKIAKALKEHDVATEVNTGLAYRYPIQEMCPSPDFLKILAQYDVDITTSSDAHFPDDVGAFLDEARERLKESGFKQIVTFDKRIKKRVELC
ncbi:histidinol phosphate phosphatase domain-containing protein [Bacillus alveayuensis]|uniref:histidinol phosphate phosphatase domain-containing protein n=1 Tax=Aeribacillus alveayuensis TaxID=279215 RepID=UPI0005D12ADD|nr:histidinol phosphate phosphatase domain-containing protein [Bacillus alveayuensis]